MKLVLFGGAFDPPHIGHVTAAETTARELRPNMVLWMPSKIPPHKKKAVTAPEHRLAMCRIAAENVSDLEINTPLSGYTVDTVARLLELYPGAEIWLLVGEDMFDTLPTWKDSERLLSMCNVKPVTRDDNSSTKLRLHLAAGKGKDRLPDGVYDYIQTHKLYTLRTLLSPKRYLHTMGTANTAKALALRYGADIKHAETAALLHDITKEEDQLKLCKMYDIMPTAFELSAPKVLHAKTAAALAEELDMPPEVVSAIRRHTTGSAEMSVLDKVIYLADFIEPFRKPHHGLDKLRVLAWEDLDAAMGYALELSDLFIKGVIK